MTRQPRNAARRPSRALPRDAAAVRAPHPARRPGFGAALPRRVLIAAPHPDDESLGCGALLAALAASGARIGALFVTDGAASHPNSRLWPAARLAARRAREADDALAALGARRAARLRLFLPDARPARDLRRSRARLAAARFAAALRPDLVLLPWRRDPHCDHRETHALVSEALRAAGLRPRVLEYPVWLDALGARADRPRAGEVRRLAVPTRWRRRKAAAIDAHASQLGRLVTDDPAGFALDPEAAFAAAARPEPYFAPLR